MAARLRAAATNAVVREKNTVVELSTLVDLTHMVERVHGGAQTVVDVLARTAARTHDRPGISGLEREFYPGVVHPARQAPTNRLTVRLARFFGSA